MQPTSPIHIKEVIEKYDSCIEKYDFLASVKEADHPAIPVQLIDEDDSLKYFNIDFSQYRCQDHIDYTPNGAIYIAKPDAYLEQKHFFGVKSIAYYMKDIESVDIDNFIDLELARIVLKYMQNGSNG